MRTGAERPPGEPSTWLAEFFRRLGAQNLNRRVAPHDKLTDANVRSFGGVPVISPTHRGERRARIGIVRRRSLRTWEAAPTQAARRSSGKDTQISKSRWIGYEQVSEPYQWSGRRAADRCHQQKADQHDGERPVHRRRPFRHGMPRALQDDLRAPQDEFRDSAIAQLTVRALMRSTLVSHPSIGDPALPVLVAMMSWAPFTLSSAPGTPARDRHALAGRHTDRRPRCSADAPP